MDKETIRLEILKIAFSNNRAIDETVKIAKALENYVLNVSVEKTEREPEKVSVKNLAPLSGKRVGNPDILS